MLRVSGFSAPIIAPPVVTADICQRKSRKLSPISVSRTSRVMRCCERSSVFFPRVVSAIASQTIAYSVPAVWCCVGPKLREKSITNTQSCPADQASSDALNATCRLMTGDNSAKSNAEHIQPPGSACPAVASPRGRANSQPTTIITLSSVPNSMHGTKMRTPFVSRTSMRLASPRQCHRARFELRY